MKVRTKDKMELEFVKAFYRNIQNDPEFLNSYLFGDNDISIEVADGCVVEHDGYCSHGYTSPLRLLGMI